MKISHLFDDPMVKAALEAAERDEGQAGADIARDPYSPLSGHACEPERLLELEFA